MGFWDFNDQAKQSQNQGNTGGAIGFFTKTIPSVAAGIGESLYKPIQAVGEGLGSAVGELSGANQQIQNATDKQQKEQADTIKILQDELSKPGIPSDKKKQLQSSIETVNSSLDKTMQDTQNYFNDQKSKTDPGHVLNNAAQLALMLGTAGAGGAALKGGESVANAAETGLKIPSLLDKSASAVKDSSVGKAANKVVNAITTPSSVKEGAAAFGGVGAAQGALSSSDQPGEKPADIALASLEGGALGAAGGAVGGFFGSKAANAVSAAKNAGIDQAAVDASTLLDKQKAPISAPTSKPESAPSQIVNGTSDNTNMPNLDPFNALNKPTLPAEVQSGTTTQLSPQDASSAPFDSSNQGQMTLDQLGQSANRPVGQTPAEFFKTQSDAKNMAQDVTPGNQTIIQGNMGKPANEVTPGQTPELTPAQQAAEALTQGKSNITQKPLQITDQGKPEVIKGPLETNLTEDIKDKINMSGLPQSVKDAVSKLGDSTNMLGSDYRSDATGKQKVLQDISNGFDNVTNTTGRLAGKTGSDFADKMQSGAQFKSKFIDSTAENVDNIEKAKESLTVAQQKESTSRVADAIAKNDISNLKPIDKTLYDNIKTLFDTSKAARVGQGRAVLDNYVTHAKLGDDLPKTDQVVQAMFNKQDPEMLSMFSKKQGENSSPVDNLYTTAKKYQQGMANDLAYHPAQKYLSENVDKIPASLANDPKNMADFKNYVTDLMEHARNGSSETAASKIVKKYALDPFTDNVLRFNIGNSAKNYTDQIRTNAVLTSAEKDVKVSQSFKDDFQKNGLNFKYGDTRIDKNSRSSKLGAIADKFSPSVLTENHQVNMNAEKGLQKGFYQSPIYQEAKASGMNDEEAQAKAWSEDKEGIQRTANSVAGTSSAGNAMNQVAALRNGKPLLGVVPWASVSRFASYPINGIMNIIRSANPQEARAIEAYARGDVMGSSMADIRGNAKQLLDMYTNASKHGDSGIPDHIINMKIDVIKNAISTIDDELAKTSNISKANTAKTYAKIWGATTAIQMAVVGSQDAILNRTGSNAKQKSVGGTILGQSPFLDINRVLSPVVNGSAIQPSSTGQWGINARGITNAIPYIGGVDNATGNNLSTWLNNNVVKGTNKDISAAYK